MLSVAMLSVNLSRSRAARAAAERVHVQYVAQAGLNRAAAELVQGGSGAVGSSGAPVAYGESVFWVDAVEAQPGVFTLTATGVGDRTGACLEMTLVQELDSIWDWAAFGDTQLTTDANAQIDSYDSTAGTYAFQAVNGTGAEQHAGTDGDIGSNGDVLADTNVKVWGAATCGPDATTTITGNAQVSGATTPLAEPVTLPPIVLPAIPYPSSLTVNGSSSLPAGDHGFSTLTVKGTLTVTGPARLVLGSFVIKSAAELVVDATAGPVEIWVINDFLINSNSLMHSTTDTPADLAINLLSDNIINPEIDVDVDADSVDFNSNAKIFGTIYAPNAHLEVDSNFELFGSMVASSIHLASNSKIHFDESLAAAREDGTWEWVRVGVCARPYKP